MDRQPDWNVLLIDDDEDDYIIVKSILNAVDIRKISLVWSKNSREAAQALGQQKFEAILVDYHLGKENGIDLIQSLAKSGITIPMIIISGKGGDAIDFKAMSAGALFYFDKSELAPRILERTIRYGIERKKIVIIHK